MGHHGTPQYTSISPLPGHPMHPRTAIGRWHIARVREVFQVAGDFPDEWVQRHINEQEAYALKQLLVLFSKEPPE